MGIILESNDYLVDKVLDISIIFIMGIILLFFFYAMMNHNKVFITTYMIYISILMVYFLIYIHNKSKVEKSNNHYNILTFTGIYTVFLNIFVIGAVGFGFFNKDT